MNVGFEQCFANLSQPVPNVRFGELPTASQYRERGLQAVGDTFKHIMQSRVKKIRSVRRSIRRRANDDPGNSAQEPERAEYHKNLARSSQQVITKFLPGKSKSCRRCDSIPDRNKIAIVTYSQRDHCNKMIAAKWPAICINGLRGSARR